MLMACTLGHRFSIVTTMARSAAPLRDLVRTYGLAPRCVSVRTVEVAVAAVDDDPALSQALFRDEGRRALDKDGAEVVVLGCAGLGGMDKSLEADLGVPVLDPVACAVKLAEACAGYGLRTSKRGGYAAITPIDPLERG